ncbi:MAG: alanine--tRNA ligase [Epsilonproteobacteria bacterium]|nr:alanine--tRNA ligase [Campylobacterota bacterium]
MDIRKMFLDYFKSKGHKVVPSSPLVPEDNSLLFTNAGMVQFKKIFTGEEPIPNPPRATSSQTCIRAGGKHNDLDNVGYTARHHTFFEMLGNFSFGDYFKDKAIEYAWEFVTGKDYLNLPKDKLYVTVHEKDDEAYNIWKKYIDEDRIYRFGDKDNFWQMGDTGPCGPCSEIFYDQGEEHFNSPEDVMGGDGDRFLEIWNLVFMQYERDENGKLHPLPKPSIDTGMGLERVVAIKEGVFNNYDSSLFMPIINKIKEIVGKEPDEKSIASFRVIADHLRSTTFLLAQGVTFDKEGRGYVLRRIMRRAIRHGYLLGLREPFMHKLVDTLVEIMKEPYDYLEDKKEAVKAAMRVEEENFFRTIESGIKLFEEELKKSKDKFSGEVAFKLYDTYGFPLDLTQDMLREKGIELDIEGFNKKMQEQKEKSKANWKGSGDNIVSGDFKVIKEKFGVNEFVGYESLSSKSKVLAILDDNFKIVNSANSGWVFLDKTPFYAESGGQVGDKGELRVGNRVVKILDTKKFNELNLSKFEGELKVGDEVEAIVDSNRLEIAKHHSATHLLHAALRDILGSHVSQAGSFNDDKKLRFDFTHNKPLTKEELERVEDWVNDKILKNLSVKTEIMPLEEAKKSGAIALFGEKYQDKVRVVKMENASVELCGGTHVKNTGIIGNFIITKESGVSAGVRRIEAICGRSALNYFKENRKALDEIKAELKSNEPIKAIKNLKEEIKTLKDEIKKISSQTKKELNIEEINGVKVIVDELGVGDIKAVVDDYKNRFKKVAIILFQKKDNKALVAAGVKGVDISAKELIKEVASLIKGGGGGRDDFAQAGGKDISKINEAIKKAKEYIKEKLVQ